MDEQNLGRQHLVDRFRAIASTFSQLRSELIIDGVHTELALDLPAQPGLLFHVSLNLQGDELHLNAGSHFWLEWFPCNDGAIQEDFFEAAHGLLSGRFRILEQYSRGTAYEAILQRPTASGWESRGTWSRLHLPAFRTTQVILQNIP